MRSSYWALTVRETNTSNSATSLPGDWSEDLGEIGARYAVRVRLGGETTRSAAVEEVRGERFKAKSTPQREHDATATGWGMAEGVSVNHFPFELVATATVFDVVETSVV